MITTDPYLIKLVGRYRVRAEQCLGFIALSQEIINRLEAAKVMHGEGGFPEIVDDGTIGQTPFTFAHYEAFLELFRVINSIGQDIAIQNALNALRVRSIGVIIPQLPDVEGGLEPLPSMLRYVIRPLAPMIRAMFAQIGDDEPLTSSLLNGFGDDVVIDDGRIAEMIQPVPAASIRTVNMMLQQLTGPGTSDILARAIDAACLNHLGFNGNL